MFKIDYSNIEKSVVGNLGIEDADLKSLCDESDKAIEKLKEWKENGLADFLNLPTENDLNEISKTAKKYAWAKDILVLGIGGSALGLKCIERAYFEPYYLLSNPKKRLFVMDNVDPEQFECLCRNLDWNNLLVIVISKSGKTLETASQFYILRQKLEKKFKGEWKKHIVFVTDSKNGILRKTADDENIETLSIPANLGGRFSVLSSVGLFPASVLGIDIHKLVDGAKSALKNVFEPEFDKNPSLKWALVNFLLMKKGLNVSVIMPYSYRLELLSDWYLQLFAESIGKDGKGMTPVKAVGSTDQHSQLQLYMQGPKDKFVVFITTQKYSNFDKIENNIDSDFDYLKGRGLGDVISAEAKATAKALAEFEKPNITIRIDMDNILYSLGEIFFFMETATAFMGALMDINPFDQPGVERGKVLAKGILQSK